MNQSLFKALRFRRKQDLDVLWECIDVDILFKQNFSCVLKLFLSLFINYIILFFQSSIGNMNNIWVSDIFEAVLNMLLNITTLRYDDVDTTMSIRRCRYDILCVWKLEWLHARSRNHLNNAALATTMRELTFSFIWKAKNWIVSVIIITIEDHNDVTTTVKQDRMNLLHQLSFWTKEFNIKHAKRSNNNV